MGTDYYLISPKLKAKFYLGRGIDPDGGETLINAVLKSREGLDGEIVDTEGWTLGNLTKQKLAGLLRVIDFYERTAWAVSDCMLERYFFIHVMKEYDGGAFIITDYDEDFGKYGGYQELGRE